MPKPLGNPFTLEEKRAILRYIIENEAYYKVKGDLVWKQMSDSFETHTWQSLKEHFKKRLYPDLSSSDFGLTEAEIKKFRLGFRGCQLSSGRTAASKKRSPSPSPDIWSGDDDDAPCSVNTEPDLVQPSTSRLSQNNDNETKKTVNCDSDSSDCEFVSAQPGHSDGDIIFDSDETYVDSDECREN